MIKKAKNACNFYSNTLQILNNFHVFIIFRTFSCWNNASSLLNFKKNYNRRGYSQNAHYYAETSKKKIKHFFKVKVLLQYRKQKKIKI